MRIGVLNLSKFLKTEYAEPLAANLLAGVGTKRQERICRYFRPEDRLRSLAAEHLLMKMLKEDSELPEEAFPLAFLSGEHGKPMIKDHPELPFNLSHAGEWVVCALADHCPVGVDVQDWRGIKEAVARRCFTDEERKWMESRISAEKKEQAFYRLWTLKESFIKVTGIGMKFPMKQVEFTIEDQVTVTQSWNEKRYLARNYEFPDGTEGRYELAVCSEEKPAEQIERYRMNPDGRIEKM